MKIEDYPPQEPLSDFAKPYHDACISRAEMLDYEEFLYGEDAYQSVLVCRANNPTGHVLAFVHGGGWISGYKEWMAFMGPALSQWGITFASIGYRLAPRVFFPDGYQDVLDGFAGLVDRIGEFGGRPDRVFVGGHSAGGHYSSLMAVSTDWQRPRNMASDIVKGCLPISGVYDCREGNGMSARPRFLGPEDSETDQQASPVVNIRHAPPFFMAWGSDDFPHLKQQGADMALALRKAGASVETIELEGCDHLGASLEAGDPDGDWAPHAARWMQSQV
ncbi:MAG: alpha/beta hydrolase [Rhodospirillaceae bacterium]|nr:alpha/beta hydrolase [Rhodospirillaceae bacterium]